MQRETDQGVIISCDFCGIDWDPTGESDVPPMVEGHRGSVVCLACVRRALAEATPSDAEIDCSMCLMNKPAGTRTWRFPVGEEDVVPGRNLEAAACWSCVRLAAKTFHKDKDIEFRWDPSEHPSDT